MFMQDFLMNVTIYSKTKFIVNVQQVLQEFLFVCNVQRVSHVELILSFFFLVRSKAITLKPTCSVMVI